MSILPERSKYEWLTSSWTDVYSPEFEKYKSLREFGTSVGNVLHESTTAWQLLSESLSSPESAIPNFISLGSGLKPWISRYLDGLATSGSKNLACEINLFDFAFSEEVHKVDYPEFIQKSIRSKYPMLLERGLNFSVSTFGGDLLEGVRNYSEVLPKNNILEIRSLLSYVDWVDFKDMITEHILPKTSAVIIVQEKLNSFPHLISPQMISDCREIDVLFEESGLRPIFKVEIPVSKQTQNIAGVYVRSKT